MRTHRGVWQSTTCTCWVVGRKGLGNAPGQTHAEPLYLPPSYANSAPPSVTKVVDNGPAFVAGVYPGDVVVSINDHVSRMRTLRRRATPGWMMCLRQCF